MAGFEHDYKEFPELTNTELQILGLTSPHVQYTEDFPATVVKVHDGDTVTLRTDERDFVFPLRLLDIDAPELNEEGGYESQAWLHEQIHNEEVQILIDKNRRVGKYGRLLGHILHRGMNMNEIIVMNGYAKPFEARDEGDIPDINKIMLEGAIE